MEMKTQREQDYSVVSLPRIHEVVRSVDTLVFTFLCFKG